MVLLSNLMCLYLAVHEGPKLRYTCLYGCRVAPLLGLCLVKALFSGSSVATDDGLNDE